jgi:hypothetical protein
MMTLQQAAEQIAKQSLHEISTEPEAYGCNPNTVREWIDWELEGDGPQALMRIHKCSFLQAAAALTEAMNALADDFNIRGAGDTQ